MPGYSQGPLRGKNTSECPRVPGQRFQSHVLARLLAVCFVLWSFDRPAVPANASRRRCSQFLDGSVLHGKLSEIQTNQGVTWQYASAKQPLVFYRRISPPFVSSRSSGGRPIFSQIAGFNSRAATRSSAILFPPKRHCCHRKLVRRQAAGSPIPAPVHRVLREKLSVLIYEGHRAWRLRTGGVRARGNTAMERSWPIRQISSAVTSG